MLTREQVQAIENVLSGGDRIELIPVKDGVKVLKISKKEVKITTK